jgi:two-component system chemotaxis response regulator CheY
LIVDNDLNTRQSVKNILHNNGYREIRLGRNLGNVREILGKSMPDLLICSCDLPDGDFLNYIREIRQGTAGNNPFLPIITLLETPTPELVSRIIESGTDTVIAKPISTAQLLDRIDDIIEARKKFVVSDSYIGPARRKDQALRGVEPPNLLRAKAEGQKLRFAEVEAMISGALGKMKSLKIDVLGTQISSHITNLVPMLERSGRLDPTIRQELLGLLDITDNSREKLAGTAYEHVVEICDSIGNVASAILAARGGVPDPRDMKLLKPLSQAVQACFSGAITNAQQVSAIVRQIGAR